MSEADLVAKIASRAGMTTGLLPAGIRSLTIHNNATTVWLVEVPPMQVMVRFQPVLGSVSNLAVPLHFPWQVFRVVLREARNVSTMAEVQCFWNTKPINHTEDLLNLCITPNVNMHHHACLGSITISPDPSPIIKINKLLGDLFCSAYNADWMDTFGEKLKIAPMEIISQQPQKFNNIEIDAKIHPVPLFFLKWYQWEQTVVNPARAVCELSWPSAAIRVGSLIGASNG